MRISVLVRCSAGYVFEVEVEFEFEVAEAFAFALGVLCGWSSRSGSGSGYSSESESECGGESGPEEGEERMKGGLAGSFAVLLFAGECGSWNEEVESRRMVGGIERWRWRVIDCEGRWCSVW